MKTCLVCQNDSDRVELLRIPVRVEGDLFGHMLVCRGCFDLLGADEVKSVVTSAVAESSYEDSQFIRAEAAEGSPPKSPRNSAEFSLTPALLDNPEAFAKALGENLAPLLLDRYRAGQNHVNLLTVCGETENGLLFRAVAENP
jgi:hypothetical protein